MDRKCRGHGSMPDWMLRSAKKKADEIRDAWEDDPSSVETEVYHYDPEPNANGETHSDVYHVNEAGEKVGSAEIVECHKDGERIDLKNGG